MPAIVLAPVSNQSAAELAATPRHCDVTVDPSSGSRGHVTGFQATESFKEPHEVN